MWKQYSKAIVAAVVTGLSTLEIAYQSGNSINGGEYISAAIATLVALGAVFGTTNSDPMNIQRIKARKRV